MGMSANQVRFLSLTARNKQEQVNNPDNMLSKTDNYNQNTNTYNPATSFAQDYTKLVYSFNDQNEKNTITSLTAKPNGLYHVKYLNEKQNRDIVSNGSVVVNNKKGQYYVGTTPLRPIIQEQSDDKEQYVRFLQDYLAKYIQENELFTKEEQQSPKWKNLPSERKIPLIAQKTVNKSTRLEELKTQQEKIQALDDYNTNNFANAIPSNWAKTNIDGKYKLSVKNTAEFIQEAARQDAENKIELAKQQQEIEWFKENEKSIPEEQKQNLKNEEIVELLKKEKECLENLQKKYDQEEWMVKYNKNSETGKYEPQFFSKKEIDNADYSKQTGNSQQGIKTYSYGDSTAKEVKNATAKVEQDASGKFVSIMIFDENNVAGKKYALNSTTEKSEVDYQKAMEKYSAEKTEFEQKNPNKNLELKLKQLDKEENSISNEIKTVKKVVSKNVQSSFKTFNA